MQTFTHGQQVTCTIGKIKITYARISIDSDGKPFICQNEVHGSLAENMFGYKYSWVLNKDFTQSNVSNLKPLIKHFEDIEVGDVIVGTDGKERPILMRSGEVVVIGYKQSYGYSSSGTYTIAELKHEGYALKTDTPIKMTLEEIATKLGYAVEVVE